MLERADDVELRVVRQLARMTQLRPLRIITIAVTQLGNGWIYAPIAIGVLLFAHSRAWAIVAAAALATAIAHVAHAVLKRCVARPRPFARDSTLQPFVRALDHYSFPSGHCMTLAAVLVPVVRDAPTFWPAAVIALIVLAWCRVAVAHHYPSDIFAGIALGVGIAVPLAAWLIPV